MANRAKGKWYLHTHAKEKKVTCGEQEISGRGGGEREGEGAREGEGEREGEGGEEEKGGREMRVREGEGGR